MGQETEPGDIDEGLWAEIASDYLRRQRSGENPSIESYIERYPHWAGVIRRRLEALAAMGQDPTEEGHRFRRPRSGVDLNGNRGAEPLNLPVEEEAIPSSDAAGIETPAVSLRGFRILRQVGRGGMGIVYEAIEEALGRRVAIKILRGESSDDPHVFERFEREMAAAGKLQHEHIVPVFSVGEDQGRRYYVMQLIEGTSLDRVVATTSGDPKRKDGAPSGTQSTEPVEPCTSARLDRASSDFFQNIAKIGFDAARALQYAHRQGVLHRDVKPSNLMLDREGKIWITDFGIAKAIDQDDLTATGEIVGTIRYLPPERLRGKSDVRGDVYSLGLTLYELATGERVFGHLDPSELMPLRFQQDPKPVLELAPTVPPSLAAVIEKAIRTNPSHRYQSALELADELERFLAGEPVEARPPSAAERIEHVVRRNPAYAAIVLMFLLGSAVSVPLLTTLYFRAEANKRLAEANEAQAIASKDIAESAAKRAQSAERASMRREMRLGMIRGIEQAKEGGIADALPWFLRTWEIAEEIDLPDWQRLARENLAFWASRLPTPIAEYEHPGQVNALAFSPDGRWMVTGCRAGAPRLWNLEDGSHRALTAGVLGHTFTVWSVAFSPDGTKIATGSSDSYARLWNAEDGKQLAALSHSEQRFGNFKDIWKVAFTPDGEFLLTSDSDGVIRRWNTITGENIGFENGQLEWNSPWTHVMALAVAQDGTEFTFGTLNSLCRVALPSGDLIEDVSLDEALFPGQEPEPNQSLGGRVTRLDYSKDGKSLFALRRGDCCVRLDVPFQNRVVRYRTGHDEPNAMMLSKDQNRLLVGMSDGRCLQWIPWMDTRLDPPLMSPFRVNDLDVTMQGDCEVLGIAAANLVSLWMLPPNLIGNPKAVAPSPIRLALMPDQEIFVRSRTSMMGFRLGNAQDRWPEPTTETFPMGPKLLAGIPSRQQWIVNGLKNEFLIATVQPQEVRFESRLCGTSGELMTLATSPNHLLTVSSSGRAQANELIVLWDVDTPKPLREWVRPNQQSDLACFVGTEHVALSGPSGIIECLRTEDLGPIATRDSITPLSGAMSAMAGEGRSKRVALGTTTGMIGIWEVMQNRIMPFAVLHRGSVESLRFSPEGDYLLSTGSDGLAWRWDLRTGLPVGPPVRLEEQIVDADWIHGDREAVLASESWLFRAKWTKIEVPTVRAAARHWIEVLLGDSAEGHFEAMRVQHDQAVPSEMPAEIP